MTFNPISLHSASKIISVTLYCLCVDVSREQKDEIIMVLVICEELNKKIVATLCDLQ